MFNENDVVQFTENHPWCGCFGIVEEVRPGEDDVKYMVGVPVPQGGTAYIFVWQSENNIEYVGRPIMVAKGDRDE